MLSARNLSVRGVGAAFVILVFALAPAASRASAGDIGCGAVLTEDTILNVLMHCPDGDGLVIGASGITVDMTWGGLYGSGTPGTAGIRNHGFHDVVIKNGEIENFGDGIVLKGAKRNLLTRLIIEENEHAGLVLAGSHRNRIVSNNLFYNTIVLRGSHGNRITDNDVEGIGDGRSGLCGWPPRDCAESAAIALYGSRGNRIQANDASASFYGYALFDSSDRNALFGNKTDAAGEGWNFIGIAVFDSDRTLIRRNDVSGVFDDGIFIARKSRWTSIERNTGNRYFAYPDWTHRGDGIDVDDPHTFIARNSANGNGDLGIEAVKGSRDGGGNKASGNGNPRQCIGVSCLP